MSTHFEQENIKIINGDSTNINLIEKESIDLVCTSPPYNVGIEYGDHDDSINYSKYLDFSVNWILNCYDWLKNAGRICINIPFETAKYGKQTVGYDVMNIAKQCGFRHMCTAIWYKGGIVRGGGTWMSPKAPFIAPPVEAVLLMYKGEWKRKDADGKKIDILEDEYIKWSSAIWTICTEDRTKLGHPAPFPIELPRRCIKLLTFVDDVVLDPFAGSGSTLIAAYRNNRKSIGIEISKEYCELAKKRLLREIKIRQSQIF